MNEWEKIQEVLQQYELMLGGVLNRQKTSILFIKNTSIMINEQIK